MTGSLLYLSRSDIRAIGISPAEARQAILQVFREYHQGSCVSLPKSSLDIGPGHVFQSLLAASSAQGVAALKWVSTAPVPAGSNAAGTSGLICINDYESGAPTAVMDGDEITLIRTAAMSAAAATYLAPEKPRTIGMVGCGLQAHAHLAAFADLFPQLQTLLACSRSASSAEKLASAARESGLDAEIVSTPQDLLARADIVISMVPGTRELRPFLDARLLLPNAFVSAVDIGRSWLPETFPSFDLLVTDSLTQSRAPYDIDGQPVATAAFSDDLVTLSATGQVNLPPGRKLFCFRGFAIADLALAHAVLKKAQRMDIGKRLER